MPPLASRPRGPRGGQTDTRADIVSAARALFIARGYDATSMRAIAKLAGVDPSLPRHYFPAKSTLFVEAVAPVDQVESVIARVLEGPQDSLGDRMVTTFVQLWDSPELGGRLRALVTSAAAAPEVADAARAILFDRFFVRIARSLGPEGVEARAAAALSQMLGIALVRYVLQAEPIAGASAAELTATFGPAVQRLITGSAHKS